MKQHEERVVTEKRDLDAKIIKLREFCFGENNNLFRSLELVDRYLLEDQYHSMVDYSEILGKRIARFKV